MNKLAIIVPFYKRDKLTALCFKRLKSQSKRLGVDVIVAGSEGEKSEKIAKGLKYIETPNKPLGAKLNALLKECKEYDGVIIIGSDDFMSDSIIKQHQKTDVSKEVYYSFNDIYIYSAKYQTIASDFTYTRVGNGIGVARLYTKPTLEKMEYEIWSNDQPKGLDGNADKRLRSRGAKEIQIDLGDHFLIDAKVEQNISAHEIVNTGHKVHELSEFKRLGAIGASILKLVAEDEERIDIQPVKLEGKLEGKLMGKVIKEFYQFEKGMVYEFKKSNFNALIKDNYIEEVN